MSPPQSPADESRAHVRARAEHNVEKAHCQLRNNLPSHCERAAWSTRVAATVALAVLPSSNILSVTEIEGRKQIKIENKCTYTSMGITRQTGLLPTTKLPKKTVLFMSHGHINPLLLR